MKHYVMISRSTFWSLVLCACLSIGLVVNLVHQVAAKENTNIDSFEYLKNFTDVISLIQRNYVSEVKFSNLVDGAIKGMLMSLDPHSSYLTPETYKELQVETRGEFGGLGIEISIRDGLLTVVAPIEDSPATRAGVLAGDQIIKIGDEFTRDLSLVDAVKKMRGPKGSPITISVHREGVKELIPLTVVRDIIKVKSIRYRMLEDDVGYVRLAQFQEGSEKELENALSALKRKTKDRALKGLVLDLRNNPGGLLTQATKVSDIFLRDGVIVYTEGRLESQKQEFYAHDDGNEPSYPLVVLVNGGSASASEIVSGALQDAGRAIIVGNQTFGKGSVQTVLPLESGGALRLTTALYFTKSGRSIQAQGITPDLSVSARRFPKDSEESFSPELQIKERDLPGAIKNPRGLPQAPAVSTPAGETAPDSGASSDKKIKIDEFVPGSRTAMEADVATLLKEDPQLDEAMKIVKKWLQLGGEAQALKATLTAS